MKKSAVFLENLKVAIRAIRSNRIRAILTMAIIAFGIMALVGILTAIDAIKGMLTNQFSMMGANTFSITSRGMNVVIGSESAMRIRNQPYITYREATEFKEMFQEPAHVAVSVTASGMATISYRDEETNPTVSLLGIDDSYLTVGGYEIEKGRGFSETEIMNKGNVAILGSEIETDIFENVDPLGKTISVGGSKFKVVGVLKAKGSSALTSDAICFIPVTTARHYFSRARMDFVIDIMPYPTVNMDVLSGEAEAVFRKVRGLDARDESDFNITQSDAIAQLLIENLKFVTIAATMIGFITLFGAAVGLMNIMLVSVTERTREIGTRKAMGAKVGTIRQQFLFESVLIGQFGGILGIISGILIGNIISSALGSSFIIPWEWVISGVALCLLVGLVSGYFPAVKASSVDPIEALRHE